MSEKQKIDQFIAINCIGIIKMYKKIIYLSKMNYHPAVVRQLPYYYPFEIELTKNPQKNIT